MRGLVLWRMWAAKWAPSFVLRQEGFVSRGAPLWPGAKLLQLRAVLVEETRVVQRAPNQTAVGKLVELVPGRT
jgi:hypothetical protein